MFIYFSIYEREDGSQLKFWNLISSLQRKGSRCGGDDGVNMKCSVLQWSWKTLMNEMEANIYSKSSL